MKRKPWFFYPNLGRQHNIAGRKKVCLPPPSPPYTLSTTRTPIGMYPWVPGRAWRDPD